MLPIDIFSGTLRAVVNQCLEFASVVDWCCSCHLLCRAAVVCCVGHFEPVLEGSVRRVLHSRDVNRRCAEDADEADRLVLSHLLTQDQ